MSVDRDRLDRWITGGRYHSEKLIVRCLHCGESSLVVAESEFGATIWIPENCPECGKSWEGNSPWEIDSL